jgi:HAD superfamily hydrolase (TIGR01458 family)
MTATGTTVGPGRPVGEVRALLLDLDGTLYASGRAIAGAAQAVQRLRTAGLVLRFLTNTDSKDAREIADAVGALGIAVAPEELFTPLEAARALVSAHPGARALPLLSPRLAVHLTGPVESGPFSHVVVGDVREVLDYPLLDTAFRALRSGAQLIALQRGRYFKRDDGDHIDTGAVVAALEYSSGVEARVVGKPSVDFFAAAATSAGVRLADCMVVGDDATTDVAGGSAAGARTVQVRTGKYADQVREGLLAEADVIVDSVAQLPDLLRETTR